MKRFVLAAIVLALGGAVANSASGSTASAGPCNVTSHTGYPGAPPPFQIPPGGSETDTAAPGGTTCVISRADGTRYATAFEDSQGDVIQERYFDANEDIITEINAGGWGQAAATPTKPSSSPQVSSTSGHKTSDVSCAADDRNPGPWKWDDTVQWWVNHTIPATLNETTTITNLRNAHTEWTSNDSWCSGIGDSSSSSTSYQGRKDVSFGQAGTNIVGWGDTSKVCSGNPAGCEQTWYTCGSRVCVAIEGDIRLDSGHTWSNASGGSAGDYDVWYTAAHEVGHLAQFGHVSDSTQNVMDPAFGSGDTTGRHLGKGDANENNAHY